MSNSVWTVASSDYDHYMVYGIFSSEGLAREYIESNFIIDRGCFSDGFGTVETYEYELNDAEPQLDEGGHHKWCASQIHNRMGRCNCPVERRADVP